MKLYQSLTFFAAALILTACGAADEPENTSTAKEIIFSAVHPAQISKVTDTDFESKDQIGVYMTTSDASLQTGGNVLNNELLTYSGSAWTSARPLYWDEGVYNVYAYYPYSTTIDDTVDYTFTVSTDQNTDGAYQASDFLWATVDGVTASAETVKLQFSHRMSKAIVKLEKSEEFEGEIPSNCEVYIHNTVPVASIDLATGGVSKDLYSSASTIRARKLTNDTYCAIVVPQNIESRRPLVEIVTGGVSYLMEGKISFRQGMAHTMVVTLSKNPEQTKIEIGGNIGGWD